MGEYAAFVITTSEGRRAEIVPEDADAYYRQRDAIRAWVEVTD